MGDLRRGLFHQMEGTIRGHPAEASRPASRGDGFGEQKQAMINLGGPEAVAEDRAKALILFAEGDAGYVADDVPSILGPAGPELRTVCHRLCRSVLLTPRHAHGHGPGCRRAPTTSGGR